MGKGKKGKLFFSILPACMCLLLVSSFSIPAEVVQAEEEDSNRKLVRVGFPIQKNETEKNEDGTYSGYTVDFLKEIVHYTGWEIEYVEAEGDINTQLGTLGNMLDTGEIDMLGTMYISDLLQDMYLYPAYSYGSTYTALTAAEDNTRWQADDFQGWNGIRVAFCDAQERRMSQLQQLAQISGFTYETLKYEDVDAVCDAVRKGEADACLQSDISVAEGLRIIARFNPAPYYFALNKERTDLLKELNSAMNNLLEAYPGLQNELYSRYFLQRYNVQISDEDRAWIESLGSLRILYLTGNAPIQNKADDQPCGVAASFMETFAEASGLKMAPVFADSYEEGMELIKNGEVDMVAAAAGTSELNSEGHIQISLPYFESTAVWVTKGNQETGKDRFHSLSVNVENDLKNLKKSQKDAALLDAYSVSYYMRKGVLYDELHVEWADREDIRYSVGFLPSVDDRLAEIISSFAGSLSEQTKQDMLYTNSHAPVRYTLAERLEMYRWQILAGLTSLIILALLLSRERRSRNLRESEAEVERLHRFSLMINECSIKYNMRHDRLIMQNTRIVFPDRDVLQPFLAEGTRIEVSSENERRYVERLREMLRNKLCFSELELFQDGIPHWFRIDLAYIDDEYAIGRLSDINKEVHQRTRLERRASHDALTGMMNRPAMQHQINEYLEKKKEGIFLLLDLDNFKTVNDTMGHREGDKVLQMFAAFLEEEFRMEDCKARLGGDEFVVFIPVRMSKDVLQDKLAQVLKDVDGQIFDRYRSCRLSVSIGASCVSESICSFEELYRDADGAMYVAKYGGKNSYFISDGKTCTHKECKECRETCDKREYLVAHGVTDPQKWKRGSESGNSFA